MQRLFYSVHATRVGRSVSRSGGSRSAVLSILAVFRRAWERPPRATHDPAHSVHDGGVGRAAASRREDGRPALARRGPPRAAGRGAGGAHSGAPRAGAGARVRSRAGAASAPASRPARRRPPRPSLDDAPPVHRRLVVADRVQGSCGDLRRAARGIRRHRSRSPARTDATSAGSRERTASSEAFWKAELAGLPESTPLDLGLPDVGETGAGGGDARHCRPAETERTAVPRAAAAGDHEQRRPSCLGAPAQPLQRRVGRRLRRRVLRPSARAPRHRRARRAVREQRTGARPHLRSTEPVATLATQLQQQAAGAEPAPVRLPGTDPGLGRRASAPCVCSRASSSSRTTSSTSRPCSSASDARIRLLVGPDATNYPITLVVVPGPNLRFKLLWRPERVLSQPGHDDAARSSDRARGDRNRNRT